MIRKRQDDEETKNVGNKGGRDGSGKKVKKEA